LVKATAVRRERPEGALQSTKNKILTGDGLIQGRGHVIRGHANLAAGTTRSAFLSPRKQAVRPAGKNFVILTL